MTHNITLINNYKIRAKTSNPFSEQLQPHVCRGGGRRVRREQVRQVLHRPRRVRVRRLSQRLRRIALREVSQSENSFNLFFGPVEICRCANGYYGNPLKVGDTCKPCDCSGNANPYAPNWCDHRTGECLQESVTSVKSWCSAVS